MDPSLYFVFAYVPPAFNLVNKMVILVRHVFYIAYIKTSNNRRMSQKTFPSIFVYAYISYFASITISCYYWLASKF